jgi:TonB family protein
MRDQKLAGIFASAMVLTGCDGSFVDKLKSFGSEQIKVVDAPPPNDHKSDKADGPIQYMSADEGHACVRVLSERAPEYDARAAYEAKDRRLLAWTVGGASSHIGARGFGHNGYESCEAKALNVRPRGVRTLPLGYANDTDFNPYWPGISECRAANEDYAKRFNIEMLRLAPEAERQSCDKPFSEHLPLETGLGKLIAPSMLKPNSISDPSEWVTDWDVPMSVEEAGGTGTTIVRFLVTNVGRLTKCQVVQRSNYPAMDDAVCTAVVRRGGFIRRGESIKAVRARYIVKWWALSPFDHRTRWLNLSEAPSCGTSANHHNRTIGSALGWTSANAQMRTLPTKSLRNAINECDEGGMMKHRLPLMLLALSATGCDRISGLRTDAELEAPADIECINRSIRRIPGVDEVSYQDERHESFGITPYRGKIITVSHHWSYGLGEQATVQVLDDGLRRSYFNGMQKMGEPYPPGDLDRFLPLMARVNAALEKDCGLPIRAKGRISRNW